MKPSLNTIQQLAASARWAQSALLSPPYSQTHRMDNGQNPLFSTKARCCLLYSICGVPMAQARHFPSHLWCQGDHNHCRSGGRHRLLRSSKNLRRNRVLRTQTRMGISRSTNVPFSLPYSGLQMPIAYAQTHTAYQRPVSDELPAVWAVRFFEVATADHGRVEPNQVASSLP